MSGANLAVEVMPAGDSQWSSGILRCGTTTAGGTATNCGTGFQPVNPPVENRCHTSESPPRFNIIAIDCGIKHNILRHLVEIGGEVTVVPGSMPAEAILERRPDGVLVGNGPGDPAAVLATIETLRTLVQKVPIFGICLGHQLLACAFGARTYKLKFGHHGANHPVQNLATGKVEITSQNHGFAVDADSLEAAGLRATHTSLYDQSLEGFAHVELPVFAVQYHPESAPGPHDSAYLFQTFAKAMRTDKSV
jgi:carbamoyl-phosphate synthase small subunit